MLLVELTSKTPNFVVIICLVPFLAAFGVLVCVLVYQVLFGGIDRRYKGESRREILSKEFEIFKKEIYTIRQLGRVTRTNDESGAWYRIFSSPNEYYYVSAEMYKNLRKGDLVKIDHYSDKFVVKLNLLKESGERLSEDVFKSELRDVYINAYARNWLYILLAFVGVFGCLIVVGTLATIWDKLVI